MQLSTSSWGVILVMASFAMFGDPSVGSGGIISLALGGVFWGVGAWALSTLKKHMDDEDRVKKACCWNLGSLSVSALVLSVCTVLPMRSTSVSLTGGSYTRVWTTVALFGFRCGAWLPHDSTRILEIVVRIMEGVKYR